MLRATALPLGLAALLSLAAAAQPTPRYTLTRTGDVIRIQDVHDRIAASIVTTMSNAYELQVNGHDVLRKTFATVDDYKARPGLNGIPLLAPFANRLDEQAFYANGRKYHFDMELGNVRGAIPIHGFLSGSKDWRLIDAGADESSAWVTSLLEFYRFPAYMKQFPFAHTMTMTYRLQDGMLDVTTRIDNLGAESMPISVGFHPYFQLTDSAREAWTLAVGARTHWKLAPTKVPTGETEPIEAVLPNRRAVALKDVDLDDVFSDLDRDDQGRAVMSLTGTRQRLDVLLGPGFKAVVLYSPNPATALLASGQPAGQGSAARPLGRGFVAIEPMAGITDSMNLAQKGLYSELQSVAPGGSWTASFWLRPMGSWN